MGVSGPIVKDKFNATTAKTFWEFHLLLENFLMGVFVSGLSSRSYYSSQPVSVPSLVTCFPQSTLFHCSYSPYCCGYQAQKCLQGI